MCSLVVFCSQIGLMRLVVVLATIDVFAFCVYLGSVLSYRSNLHETIDTLLLKQPLFLRFTLHHGNIGQGRLNNNCLVFVLHFNRLHCSLGTRLL